MYFENFIVSNFFNLNDFFVNCWKHFLSLELVVVLLAQSGLTML